LIHCCFHFLCTQHKHALTLTQSAKMTTTADQFSCSPATAAGMTSPTSTTAPVTTIKKKNRKTTALPFGDDGYECFVGKGSCRKCGCTAYGKRRCERCFRKFCSACAPSSLQKYGQEAWEECCIGCEPYLVVVADDNAEPIFELEPESEDIVVFPQQHHYSHDHRHHHHDNHGNGTSSRIEEEEGTNHTMATLPHDLLHVPLSAFIDTTRPAEKASSTAEVPTKVPCTNQTAARGGGGIVLNAGVTSPASSTATLATLMETISSDSHSDYSIIHDDDDDEKEESMCCAPTKPPGSNDKNHKIIPTTPLDQILHSVTGQGSCAACQEYATGKCPCPSCGVKYCQQDTCQSQLHQDGTCTACSKPQQEATTIRSQSPKRKSSLVEPLDIFKTPTTIKLKMNKELGPTNDNTDDGAGIECPLTPDAGCCTACQQYAIGKTPCPGCGTKYCSTGISCQAHLYPDGTCVKCRCRSSVVEEPPESLHSVPRCSSNICRPKLYGQMSV